MPFVQLLANSEDVSCLALLPTINSLFTIYINLKSTFVFLCIFAFFSLLFRIWVIEKHAGYPLVLSDVWVCWQGLVSNNSAMR